MHNFLTSRTWSIASLACPNLLGGTTGDGNMSGKAFSMVSDCFAVKNQNSLLVFLQPVIKQTLILLWHYPLSVGINLTFIYTQREIKWEVTLICNDVESFTFVQQWRPHDFFEHSIKLSLCIKVPPPGLHFSYEVGVPSIEDPLEFIH